MVADKNESQITSLEESQIVLYKPDETIALEVKLDMNHDTVWLSKRQMAELFGRDRSTISRHISNAFQQGEVDPQVGCAFFAHTSPHGAIDGKFQTEEIEYYNLDVIISVGYRVHSQQGVLFRRWATRVLRDYLLKGYSVNQQLLAMQRQIDVRLEQQNERIIRVEDRQERQQEQLDFFVRTSTPPAEMVFFEGDFYTARVALENLIKSASQRVIIVDAYVSALTLDILDSRASGVEAVIYTSGVGTGMQRLMQEHDRLFPSSHIDIRRWRKESHDRWLIIDDTLYHCGHSLNANGGHKISAITQMGTSPEIILAEMR